MKKRYDCVVCGSCVVDLLVRPVTLDQPIGRDRLVRVDPIEISPGGIVSNAGTAMARLGMNIATFTYVGDDDWGPMLKRRYEREGIDTTHLMTYPGGNTSATAVLIDEAGDHTFAHCVGATRLLDRKVFMDHMDVFAASRMMLIGYYPLFTNLMDDLPDVFAAIRETGCLTAMDSAGDGGDLQPLDRLLPHLDVYFPSYQEAEHQTGERDPRRIITRFREAGASGLVGVKLGAEGAIVSQSPGAFVEIDAVTPPGEVVDTTGAGDSFYGGLLTGLARGLSVEQAGQLAAATGACCVTGMGATAGLLGYNDTCKLAGINA